MKNSENIVYRSILAFYITIILTMIFISKSIRILYKIEIKGQPIRKEGTKYHLVKRGTPITGGIIFVSVIIMTNIICGRIKNRYMISSALTIFLFSLIGITDDYIKIKNKNSRGIKIKVKVLAQIVFATMIVKSISTENSVTEKSIYITNNIIVELKSIYLLVTLLIIISSSNATNLTDGLDGLAISQVIVIYFIFITTLYILSDEIRSYEKKYIYIREIEEMTIFCATIIGSCLGFLWYNTHPAKVFMGDSGSLTIGATIGLLSIVTKNEINIIFISFILVIETISVILQITFFKVKKRKIFKMAPIHHHFEQIGVPEFTVSIRMIIIALVINFINLISIIY